MMRSGIYVRFVRKSQVKKWINQAYKAGTIHDQFYEQSLEGIKDIQDSIDKYFSSPKKEGYDSLIDKYKAELEKGD